MDNKRSSPRKRTLKTGKILFGEKDAVTVDCIVRNVSETGARLQVPVTIMIPGAFKLALAGNTRSGDLMGVRFD